MKILSAKSQLTAGLVCMQVSILCAAMLFGFVPEQQSSVMSGRADLCETLAIMSSQYMSKSQPGELTLLLTSVVEHNDNILSAAVRSADGRLLQEIGEHQKFWSLSGERSTENELLVPIHAGDQVWGNVELRFVSVTETGAIGLLNHPWVRMTLFMSVISSVLFYLYMKKMLRHLDPSNAVPKRVRDALDSLAEGLLVVDRNGRIVLANQAFADWMGRPPEKLVGLNASDFDWTTREADDGGTGYPWIDAIAQEAPQAGVMLGLSHADRPRQVLMTNASPVLGYDGRYGGVLVSFDDVSQLEETRKDLKTAKDVADEARDMAEHANQAKSEFLARMSHEIRTPMNAILGYTDVLRSDFDEDIEHRMDHLNTIHASGEHLMALINDILDLSKIESGHMELDLQRHSLQDLISQVMAVMKMQAEEKNIGLNFAAATPVPETFVTDAVRFRQALFNLVGNAVKFTSEGEVRIVVGMSDQLLKIDVIDTGIGIPEDALEKVFDRFTQADITVSGRFGGTGLGLSIARQLSRKMGGDVTVTSVAGQGSTFTLTVAPGPLQGIRLVDPTAAALQSAQRKTQGLEMQLPSCRILIVDDEQANRKLAGIYISRAGGKWATAEDGRQAVDMASREHFDVILMDLHMPELNGIEATKCLRQLGCTTPIIALTANIMKDDELLCKDAGCNGVLHKPIRMADLITGLNRVLHDENSTQHGRNPLPATTPKRSVVALKRSPQNGQQSLQTPLTPVSNPEPVLTESKSVTRNSHENMLEEIQKRFRDNIRSRDTEDSLPAKIESSLPTDDPEFYDIVADFVPRLHSRVAMLRQCFDAADYSQLREQAHWLAGSGASVGFEAFSDPARELEAAAKQHKGDNMPDMILRLEQIAARVVLPKPPAVHAAGN